MPMGLTPCSRGRIADVHADDVLCSQQVVHFVREQGPVERTCEIEGHGVDVRKIDAEFDSVGVCAGPTNQGQLEQGAPDR